MHHLSALLFGYNSDFFIVRLISLTLILIISNLQLVITRNQVLMEVIADADTISMDREKKMSFCGQVMVYTTFMLYLSLPVGLLGVIFLLVAQYPSMLGLIAMFATVIILHRHASSFWNESYKVIGMLTQIFVLVTYTMDFFIYIAADQYP